MRLATTFVSVPNSLATFCMDCADGSCSYDGGDKLSKLMALATILALHQKNPPIPWVDVDV